EASVRLTDPLLVSDVMETLSQMAHRVTGLNGGVAARLAGTAVNIRRRTVPSLAKRGELKVVLGPQHAEYVLAARDAARQQIELGSHKLGRSARALALSPAAAAVRDGLVAAHLYYDELSEGVSHEAAERLIEEYASAGVSIIPVGEPRMHGKFLAWDDDDLLITSQNLLSADPTDPYAEVGIVIKAVGVARSFREKFIGKLAARQRA
ncbi:hypothetical protein U1872_22565, partial [Sphingomonas sp. RB3P16]|uniref:hypothetical protein n=1 Tax=Parasphingomonas frigoris TaxID=3096163 RepID=UPI002FCC8A2B